MKPIDLVFSVCDSANLETWSFASQHIPARIPAGSYRVIVPDQQVDLFRERTCTEIEVVAESRYVGDLKDDLRGRLPASLQNRLGWYLQQMIKLAVLAELSENQTALIWDADTVPIQPLTFFTPAGQARLFSSREHHEPYFAVIEKLLGMKKAVPFSFIAQCFPMRGHWMQDFIRTIEEAHQQPWQLAIMNSIDFNQVSGFSEYETLGTFLAHRHSQQICFADEQWLRRGNSKLGGIRQVESPFLRPIVAQYLFVVFERWDAINRNPPWMILIGWPFQSMVRQSLRSFHRLARVGSTRGSGGRKGRSL